MRVAGHEDDVGRIELVDHAVAVGVGEAAHGRGRPDVDVPGELVDRRRVPGPLRHGVQGPDRRPELAVADAGLAGHGRTRAASGQGDAASRGGRVSEADGRPRVRRRPGIHVHRSPERGLAVFAFAAVLRAAAHRTGHDARVGEAGLRARAARGPADPVDARATGAGHADRGAGALVVRRAGRHPRVHRARVHAAPVGSRAGVGSRAADAIGARFVVGAVGLGRARARGRSAAVAAIGEEKEHGKHEQGKRPHPTTLQDRVTREETEPPRGGRPRARFC